MQTCIRSRSTTPNGSPRNRAYETTYKREFISKRPAPFAEGVPLSQRFITGTPFQLSGPVGDSIYATDFTNQKDVLREPFFRPNTNRANRPHPHKHFPYWPRRSESLSDLRADETNQALSNQLDSTYQVDYTGKRIPYLVRQYFDLSCFFQERHQDFHYS